MSFLTDHVDMHRLIPHVNAGSEQHKLFYVMERESKILNPIYEFLITLMV